MTLDRPTWSPLAAALRWPAALIVALVVVVVAVERACNRAHEQGRATVARFAAASARYWAKLGPWRLGVPP